MLYVMSNIFSRDSWAEIIEAISSNWFRTILTAFGVLWGIFILVILLAAGNGLENGVKQGFNGMATNSMFMWTQTISQPYKGLPKGRRYNFKLGDVEAIKQQVPGLKFVSPRNQLRSEEHTSELQSRPHLVCRLLLEKKK